MTTNLTMARAAWIGSQPRNYAFEVSYHAMEWGPASPFSGVIVQNDVVVETERDETILPPTIEEHWQRILKANQDGSLREAMFTVSGVPVDWLIDKETVADDSFRVRIRNFAKR